MKFFIAMFTTILLITTGVSVYIYLGLYDIAADTPHNKLVYQALETLRDRSIAERAAAVEVPPLDDPGLVAEGAEHYSAMCSGCHLAPGMPESEIRAGLYPQPPDLTKRQRDDSHSAGAMPSAAARQFWIIKHGIKLTAMPAWGTTHSDTAIWGMVAFLEKLPELSTKEYQVLSRSASGHEHGENKHHEEETSHDHVKHAHGDSSDPT